MIGFNPEFQLSKIEQDYVQLQKRFNPNFVKLKRQAKDPRSPLKNSILQLQTANGLSLYQIQNKGLIGKGSYAKVKLGFDLSQQKKVAIKIGASYSEIAILNKLGYLIAVGTRIGRIDKDDPYRNRIYIVMTYFPGTSLLRCYAQLQKLPFEQRLDLAIQLCQDLKRIHDLKISHDDLHGGNILVTPDFKQIRIIDFGQSTQEITPYSFKADTDHLIKHIKYFLLPEAGSYKKVEEMVKLIFQEKSEPKVLQSENILINKNNQSALFYHYLNYCNKKNPELVLNDLSKLYPNFKCGG